MNTIVIPVSKDRPEDDVYDLVEVCKKLYPDQILRITDALVIETDDPSLTALFRKLAGQEIKASSLKKTYTCPDCGEPVSKPGKYCRTHAQQRSASKRKNGTVPVIYDLQTEFITSEEPTP